VGILFCGFGESDTDISPRHQPTEDQNFAEYIQSILDKSEPLTCVDLEAVARSRLGRTTPEVDLRPRRRSRPSLDEADLPRDNVVTLSLSLANRGKRRVRLQDATIIRFDTHWRVPDQLRLALAAVSRGIGVRRRPRPRYDDE
jgi:hypothetical protein